VGTQSPVVSPKHCALRAKPKNKNDSLSTLPASCMNKKALIDWEAQGAQEMNDRCAAELERTPRLLFSHESE